MEPKKLRKVILAAPRGFCAGVVRAIDIVEQCLQLFSPPLYVRKEIVHNQFVVNSFRQRGVIFVNELDEVPDGATVIFSAHGVSPAVREKARQKKLRAIDATCPLVTKVHLEAVRLARQGYSIVLIGHKGHEEVEGTLGEAPDRTYLVETVDDVEHLELPDPDRVAYLTQTTLSLWDTEEIVAALKRKFPKLVGPKTDDICYATQNRQLAVRHLAQQVDLVLVIGSANSSNSQRLKEVAQATGCPAYLIDGPENIQDDWLDGIETVGITSGASAPESLVTAVVNYLIEKGAEDVFEFVLTHETVQFSLPAELRRWLPEKVTVEENLHLL